MAEKGAAFIKFFSNDYRNPSRWSIMLEKVEVPGMAGASWDRRAAYLLWLATNGGRDLPALEAQLLGEADDDDDDGINDLL